jgi:hypothetical protein
LLARQSQPLRLQERLVEVEVVRPSSHTKCTDGKGYAEPSASLEQSVEMKQREHGKDYDGRNSSRDRGVVTVKVLRVLNHVECNLGAVGVFSVERSVLDLVVWEK